MIGRGDIKMEAARENAEPSLAERDYVEGRMLHAIASISTAPMIALKGGTALSRVTAGSAGGARWTRTLLWRAAWNGTRQSTRCATRCRGS